VYASENMQHESLLCGACPLLPITANPYYSCCFFMTCFRSATLLTPLLTATGSTATANVQQVFFW
jgi:hypothetical protein